MKRFEKNPNGVTFNTRKAFANARAFLVLCSRPGKGFRRQSFSDHRMHEKKGKHSIEKKTFT
jgi:hypothetical protein